jgi:putative ABC transport system permease protein
MIGRLREGVTLAAAQADFDRVAAEVRELEGREVATPRLETLTDLFVGNLRAPLLLLFVAATLVVCLTVANVGNLVVARSSARRDELAVRAALGAPRGDLFRLQLAEASWIAALGSALGAGGTLALVALLRHWIAERAAALRRRTARRRPAGDPLRRRRRRSGGARPRCPPRPHRRPRAGDRDGAARRPLVLEPALRAPPLVARRRPARARHVARDRRSQARHQPRSAAHRRQGVRGAGRRQRPPVARLRSSLRSRAMACADAPGRRRAEALPGVRSASLSLLLPLTGRSWEMALVPENRPFDPHEGDSVLYNIVSPDHFATLGIELLRGRLFTSRSRRRRAGHRRRRDARRALLAGRGSDR